MRLVVVNGLLLALAGIAILGVIAFDRSDSLSRGRGQALCAGGIERRPGWGAGRDCAGSARCVSRWLSTQVGNIYEVRGIAVRSPSVFERVVRRARGPSEVTVVLDVNRGYAGEFYQPTSDVPVVQVDGRWYLEQPLLAH